VKGIYPSGPKEVTWYNGVDPMCHVVMSITKSILFLNAKNKKPNRLIHHYEMCIMTENLPGKKEITVEMATENDIVLVYLEEKPLVFARIESILADSKPDWYHVRLLLLQLPLQVVTWILRDVYINGETFTMNGKAMRLERIASPAFEEKASESPPASQKQAKETSERKVITLKDFKKE
jgi:hypothetical protein